MIQIIHGDCIEGMKTLEEGSVSVCVTSPPYNLGIKYSQYYDSQEEVNYILWTRTWLRAAWRVLVQDGSLFLNLGSKPSRSTWPTDIIAGCSEFQVQNTIHWIKSIHVDGHTRGHVKPINSRRYLNDAHEYIFHLTKTGAVELDRLAIGVPFEDKSNLSRGSRGVNGDLRCGGNVWFLPYSTRNAKGEHPAAFPPELPARCIKLHGLARTRLVVDPFMGSGSTAVACQWLQVDCVGFDIDAAYCEYARKRVVDAEG